MAVISNQRKNKSSYSKALLILIILGGAAVLLWSIVYSPAGVVKRTVLEIPAEATATVRLGGSSNFVEIPGVGELLEGESVRALRGTGTTLTFFDGSHLSLDENSSVTLSRVRERENDRSVDISIALDSGRIWVSVPKKINPQSKVTLTSGDLTFETSGGELSFGNDTISMVSGRAAILVKGKEIDALEVGQEIRLGAEAVAAIASGGQSPEKTLISAEFQNSDWFVAHALKPLDSPQSSTAPSAEAFLELSQSPVQILVPGKNDSTVNITTDSIVISGEVPAGTEKVLVNDYSLTKFIPGSTIFSYNAAVSWGTLKKGKNQYVIAALDKDGKRDESKITLYYDPEGNFPEQEDGTLVTGTTSPSPASTIETSSTTSPSPSPVNKNDAVVPRIGGLTISDPAAGAIVDDAVITVAGNAPSNAAKIIVDDFTLTKFSAGDTSWSYRLSDVFGNRPIGSKTLVVEAYDADGKLIDKVQTTFMIEAAKATPTPAASAKPAGITDDKKYWPEMRGDALPPVPQGDTAGSTI